MSRSLKLLIREFPLLSELGWLGLDHQLGGAESTVDESILGW